ncbi:MAG TPA: DUF1648 domain-containing protein [Dehalococcoidales bacterium]
MWPKFSKSYPIHLELIPLFLLVITFYMAWANYASLPDTIPTHFNAQGLPDEWAGKQSFYSFPGFSAFMYLALTSFNIWLALVKNPRRYINLPKKRLENLTDAQAEKLLIFLNRCLFVMKTFILGLSVYLVYATIEVAHGRATGLGFPFYLILASIIVLVIFMVWQSLRRTAGPTAGRF